MWKRKKPDNSKKVSVLILAGGNSTRMGEDKQWIILGNMPVLGWAIKAFQQVEEIGEIVVVTKGESIPKVHDLVKEFGFSKVTQIIAGGNTRQESATLGFPCIGKDTDILLVHDGARPMVLEEIIVEVIHKTQEYGASVPSVPVKDTLKIRNEEGFVKSTPNREEIYLAQTPQGFSYTLYEEGLNKSKKEYTDDCQMIENLGHKVYLCRGGYENMKLTTQADIAMVEGIMFQRGML